jgi:hypothetical protein
VAFLPDTVSTGAQKGRKVFQGNLHRIPQEDYDLIVSEMKAAATARARLHLPAPSPIR